MANEKTGRKCPVFLSFGVYFKMETASSMSASFLSRLSRSQRRLVKAEARLIGTLSSALNVQ